MTETLLFNLISLLATTVLGGFMWFLKRELDTNQQSIATLTKELNEVKVNYLHRDDFKDFKMELRSMFDEIKQDIRSLKDM
jgi:hypothetical protein